MIDLTAVKTDPEVAKVVQTAFRRAVGMINGRWKLEILWLLSQGVHRFGELKRGLPGITQHMLTAQLRGLEKDGLVKRTIYAEVPPRVEYEITPAARKLRPIFVEIVKWAEEHEAEAPCQPDIEKEEE
jgi:DNA-binding HxlR family transcriptional regulator